jgi:hypothetical protein
MSTIYQNYKMRIQFEINLTFRPDKLTGLTAVRLTNGEELNGSWRGGRREGLGSITGPRLEKVWRRGLVA